MTTTTEFPSWMCGRCGYLMDAADAADNSDAVPVQGDLCLCMNCGAPYTLDGTAWRPLTAEERAALTPEERRGLEAAEHVRRLANLPDLTEGDGTV